MSRYNENGYIDYIIENVPERVRVIEGLTLKLMAARIRKEMEREKKILFLLNDIRKLTDDEYLLNKNKYNFDF